MWKSRNALLTFMDPTTGRPKGSNILIWGLYVYVNRGVYLITQGEATLRTGVTF
jgi:hypothetical protein